MAGKVQHRNSCVKTPQAVNDGGTFTWTLESVTSGCSRMRLPHHVLPIMPCSHRKPHILQKPSFQLFLVSAQNHLFLGFRVFTSWERDSCPSAHKCCFCRLASLPRRRRHTPHKAYGGGGGGGGNGAVWLPCLLCDLCLRSLLSLGVGKAMRGFVGQSGTLVPLPPRRPSPRPALMGCTRSHSQYVNAGGGAGVLGGSVWVKLERSTPWFFARGKVGDATAPRFVRKEFTSDAQKKKVRTPNHSIPACCIVGITAM